jgi:ornithine cyclodeaminase
MGNTLMHHPHPAVFSGAASFPQTNTVCLPAVAVAGLVAQRGVAACIAEIEAEITADLRRWHDFIKCPRTAHYGQQGVIELMPVGTAQQYAFKYVNGHPGNVQRGLPTVMAFGVLADMATGFPLLLADLTLSTALRTAAMSVLMARHMARADARCMAIIGNGAQSEFQALGFAYGLGLTHFRLMDRDAQASARLAKHLRAEGLQVQVCHSVNEAVQGADIITTATADKCHAGLLDRCHLAAGVHVNAIGGDCPGKTELTPALLVAANRVCVEYAPQSRVEGDVQQMPESFDVVESWQLVQGLQIGRVHEHERTVFDSVGFALEDFSTLNVLWRWVQGELASHANGPGNNSGSSLDIHLLPALADPKNLFASIATHSA